MPVALEATCKASSTELAALLSGQFMKSNLENVAIALLNPDWVAWYKGRLQMLLQVVPLAKRASYAVSWGACVRKKVRTMALGYKYKKWVCQKKGGPIYYWFLQLYNQTGVWETREFSSYGGALDATCAEWQVDVIIGKVLGVYAAQALGDAPAFYKPPPKPLKAPPLLGRPVPFKGLKPVPLLPLVPPSRRRVLTPMPIPLPPPAPGTLTRYQRWWLKGQIPPPPVTPPRPRLRFPRRLGTLG